MPEQFLVLSLLPLKELRKLCWGQANVRVAGERVPGREQSLQDVGHLLVPRVVRRGRGQQRLLQSRRGVVRWLLVCAGREAGTLVKWRDFQGGAVAAGGTPGLVREQMGV